MDYRRVFENKRRVSVLAGCMELEDMLVFLVFRRLKRTGAVLSLKRHEAEENEQGRDRR